MLPEKVKVTVVAEGVRYEGHPLNIGDRIEIEDHLVNDWVRLGIARLGWKSPEAQARVARPKESEKPKETKA